MTKPRPLAVYDTEAGKTQFIDMAVTYHHTDHNDLLHQDVSRSCHVVLY